jgi:two-component system phosphate regulon response regulator PhoB
VVEDDPALRALYRSSLLAAGYAVVAVDDGVDALRQIDLKAPSAVLLDLGLPRLTGGDVQREMRARESTRDIPIVVVTGSEVIDVDGSHVDCVLRKPVDIDDVMKAIESCLHQR